jgi:hypothetical protein
MTHADLQGYLSSVGYSVESIVGSDTQSYLVIKGISIASGKLAGKSCDVAVMLNSGVPWVPQSAVHTKPFLVEPGTLNTQASPIGPDWLYWSRRFDHALEPKAFLAHILTVLNEVKA